MAALRGWGPKGERLRGLTWAVLTETWIPFKINLLTGTVYDGAGQLEMPFDFSRIAGPGPTSPLTPAGRRRLAAILERLVARGASPRGELAAARAG